MGRNRLGLACTLEHEELRENGNALEVDAEAPEDLEQREAVVEYKSEQCAGAEEVLDAECVDARVVCRADGHVEC